MKDLAARIYQTGLFAHVPQTDGPATVATVRALVQGGICGVILPQHAHTDAVLKEIRAQFADLLIGVQGKTLPPGADFILGENPSENLPFFVQNGEHIICPKTQRVLASCVRQIARAEDVRNENWEAIRQRACAAVDALLGFELRHVGINNPDEKTSEQVAGQFERFFNFPKTDKGGAFFAGLFIESMKKPFYGTHGHIAIATNCADRAAWYLQRRGAAFNWDSAGYNEDGSLRVVYLKDEIGGFAVHILQK